MKTMSSYRTQTILGYLRNAEKQAATLDMPKVQGVNQIEWNIGMAITMLLEVTISEVEIKEPAL